MILPLPIAIVLSAIPLPMTTPEHCPKRTFAQESAYSIPLRSPNLCQSKHRKRDHKGQRCRLGCVHCYRQSLECGLLRALPRPRHAGIYRMPLVFGFVTLMSSLAPRIAAACKLRCRKSLICAGPCEGALAGHLEPNSHARAYTRDIRNFVLTHPRATILDLQVCRDVWRAGVEWAESNSCKQERETGQNLPWSNPFFRPPKYDRSSGLNPAQEAARPAQQVLCKTVKAYSAPACAEWSILLTEALFEPFGFQPVCANLAVRRFRS
jgi:hypothetical protein